MKGVAESGSFNIGGVGSISPGDSPLDIEQPGLLGVLAMAHLTLSNRLIWEFLKISYDSTQSLRGEKESLNN